MTVLASEVAKEDAGTFVFRVSVEMADTQSDTWSRPVQFKFVVKEDGTYDLVMRRVYP